MRKLDSPLHVVYVSREYPPSRRTGGIGYYVQETARGMVKRGHRVTVISASDSVWQSSTYSLDGVRVVRLAGGDFFVGRGSLVGSRLSSFISFLRRYANFLFYRWRIASALNSLTKSEHVDLIEFPEYGSEALFWALKRGKRCVPWCVRLHGSSLIDSLTADAIKPWKNFRRWFFGQVELFVAGLADAISSPSIAMANFFESRHENIEVRVVPNSIDIQMWRSVESVRGIRWNRGCDRDIKRIFFAGTVDAPKGIGELFNAVAHLVEMGERVELVLAGRLGSTGRQLYARAKSKSYDWVRFLGEIPRSELRDHFAHSDLVVFPSYHEPFGLVCIEAMASGGLVLVNNAGAFPEIVSNEENGFFLDSLSTELFSSRIREILSMPQGYLDGVRSSAVDRSLIYDTGSVLSEVEGFYRELLDRSQAV